MRDHDEELEILAVEYEYAFTGKIYARAAVYLYQIRRKLAGYLEQYKGRIPDKELDSVLKAACVAYGKSRPDEYFMPFFQRYLWSYCKDKGISLPTCDANEVRAARAYVGNGYGSFRERGDVSQPEALVVGYDVKKTAPIISEPDQHLDFNIDPEDPDDLDEELTEEESDEAISALIDAILGV